MRSRSMLAGLAAIAAAGAWGCASAPSAPDGWLPSPEDARRDPRGGWIEVEFVGADAQRYLVDGELLAIDRGRVYIAETNVVQSVALDSVATARLSWFGTNPGAVAGATIGGTLATLSNGWLLVFTAPAWIAVGTGATVNRSHDGSIRVRDAGWDELQVYARFPQGLPGTFAAGPIPAPAFAPPEKPAAPEPVVATPAVPWTEHHRKSGYWFNIGAGPGFNTDHTGLAFLAGANFAYQALLVGTRFTAVDRGAPENIDQDFILEGGSVYDIALLIGVRGTLRSVQASISAGPSGYVFNIGELEDLKGSWSGQAELYVFANRSLGVGTAVGYNWNDIRDFYVISFGIAAGIP